MCNSLLSIVFVSKQFFFIDHNVELMKHRHIHIHKNIKRGECKKDENILDHFHCHYILNTITILHNKERMLR